VDPSPLFELLVTAASERIIFQKKENSRKVMERSRKKSKVCLRTKAPKREEKSTISLQKKAAMSKPPLLNFYKT
jgi:hypothetical protein